MNVVILAAGEGKRLRGSDPKVLTALWGRPAIRYPVDVARTAGAQRIVIVVGQHGKAVARALGDDQLVSYAQQDQPLGTGHAVLAAREALAGVEGSLVVLSGDCPLITPELIEAVVAQHDERDAVITVVTTILDDPASYGRILRDDAGELLAIREARDATPEELDVPEINAGTWVLSLPEALTYLEQIGTDNAQGEVYLTDVVELARRDGRRVSAFLWDQPEDLLGFNDQAELAEVRHQLRGRILLEHLERGVDITDPDSTFIDADVQIEPGARVLPCTMIEGHVRIAAGCEVGPFAHLRDGTVMEAGAEIGNFTETKQAVLGPGSKAKHLTYLGDVRIGSNTNIGAGTITANYDGRNKHKTTIGDKAFIGSGTVLVAPVDVEDTGSTGAGAIVKRKSVVRKGETWVGVPARPLGDGKTTR